MQLLKQSTLLCPIKPRNFQLWVKPGLISGSNPGSSNFAPYPWRQIVLALSRHPASLNAVWKHGRNVIGVAAGLGVLLAASWLLAVGWTHQRALVDETLYVPPSVHKRGVHRSLAKAPHRVHETVARAFDPGPPARPTGVLGTAIARGHDALLIWDRPSPALQYHVYGGKRSDMADAERLTSAPIDARSYVWRSRKPGRWYMAVSSVSPQGQESEKSDIVNILAFR